jgi:carbon-monoxide dehydrogenase small subunit
MLMSATAMLRDNPDLSSMPDEELRRSFKGNICRCTGYENIVVAVRAAAGAQEVTS